MHISETLRLNPIMLHFGGQIFVCSTLLDETNQNSLEIYKKVTDVLTDMQCGLQCHLEREEKTACVAFYWGFLDWDGNRKSCLLLYNIYKIICTESTRMTKFMEMKQSPN